MVNKLNFKVKLIFQILKSRFCKTEKFIYLTFDDGPLKGTERCFELCRKLDVKATFFLVGSHIDSEEKSQLVNRISTAYPAILIANHSFSHANEKYREYYSDVEESFLDFLKNQEILQAKFKIARLPGYSAWVIKDRIKCQNHVDPICQIFKRFEYSIFGWDMEWMPNKERNDIVKYRVRRFRKKISKLLTFRRTFTNDHIVVLIHDVLFQNDANSDFFCKVIMSLKKDSKIVFETLDNYPSVK